MSRLFSRYVLPRYAEDEAKEIYRYLSANVASQFLRTVCNTLNLKPSGRFCTDCIIHICLTFVDLEIELALTYKIFNTHMNFLIYKVFKTNIKLTLKEIDRFECDPHEIVHHQNSQIYDF